MFLGYLLPKVCFKVHCFTVSLECGSQGLFHSCSLWRSGNEQPAVSASVDTHLGPAEH